MGRASLRTCCSVSLYQSLRMDISRASKPLALNGPPAKPAASQTGRTPFARTNNGPRKVKIRRGPQLMWFLVGQAANNALDKKVHAEQCAVIGSFTFGKPLGPVLLVDRAGKGMAFSGGNRI